MSSVRELTLRQGTENDLSALLQLVHSCEDAPRWKETVWQEFLGGTTAGNVHRVLVCEEGMDRELQGLLAATLVAEQTELESVLVRPAARRAGVGRALLREWLAWADAAGATEAILEMRASNNAALELYRSFGFVVAGRRPCYYREPVEDALLMGRRVRPS